MHPEIEKIKSYLTMTGRLVLQEATVKYSYPGLLRFRRLVSRVCLRANGKQGAKTMSALPRFFFIIIAIQS